MEKRRYILIPMPQHEKRKIVEVWFKFNKGTKTTTNQAYVDMRYIKIITINSIDLPIN